MYPNSAILVLFLFLLLKKQNQQLTRALKIWSLFILFVTVLSCGNNSSRIKEIKETDNYSDSTSLFVSYANTVFTVPSPQLANIYLKNLGYYPNRQLINQSHNVEKYSTTLKKALNFGVWGVDLGYMNLYSEAENTNDYLAAMNKLSGELGLGTVFTREVYDEILRLKKYPDSLAWFLSSLFLKADHYLKLNGQQQTCAFIIAGAWIESFYLLCATYEQYKSQQLKMILFQQKFILENVIKAVAPFYKVSSEVQIFVEQLVELAYDFDVVDFKYSYKEPVYTYKKGIMVFHNSAQVNNEQGNIETIILSAKKLRQFTIN